MLSNVVSKQKNGAKRVDVELLSNPSRDAKIEQLQKLAELMDGQFRIPGTNVEFGLDALIGLVPVVGDFICGGLSLWLVQEARRMGAPKWLIAKMLWNVAVEVGVGAVPIVGDLFDVAWKANRKNVELLKRHFEGRR